MPNVSYTQPLPVIIMKEKLLNIIILILIPIIGNTQTVDKNLVGDWVSDESRYIISFTDTTVGFFDWGDFEYCYTKSDTIFFDKRDKIQRDYTYLDSAEWKPMIKRTAISGIDTLGTYNVNDSALIINIINPAKYLENKTQWYYRVIPKSEITFDSLLVETSMCYGICPSMKFKILANGKFYFQGIAYTEELGNFSGQLSDNLIELVNSKIRQLDFNNYDSAYIAGHTDGQTRNLIVFHDNKREYLHVYGHESEPLEINVIFHYLTELYKWTDLTELDYELKFEEIEKVFLKPPPPPTDSIIEIKYEYNTNGGTMKQGGNPHYC